MSKIVIDVNASVTSRLAFEPIPAYDNFCLGYLNDVRVEHSESKDEAKWEYAGLTIPRLVLEFVQLKDQYNDKDRFFTHTEMPISSTKSDGVDKTEKNIVMMYNELWKRLKHIHDQYSLSPNYKAIDFVPSFDPELPTTDKIAEFDAFFTNFANAFNKGKDGKTPVYQPSGGDKKVNLLALKLIAGGAKNTYLVLPTFVGKGIVELAVLKNGKLDTTLKFGANETPILGSVGIRSQASVSPMEASLSKDVLDIINQNKA